MSDYPGSNSSNILELLEYYKTKEPNITCNEFKPILEKKIKKIISPSAFNELLNFISVQCGFWTASYYFSKEVSPDLNAKTESDQWKQLWQASFSAFSESFSIKIDDFKRHHDLIVLTTLLQRRVDFNKSNIVERVLTYISSFLAIKLNKIGLRKLANRIYTKSLYPKGTVGRTV
jgi:hypothetical protein